MIDIEPVMSDIERKLYETLDEQTEALTNAKFCYLENQNDPDLARQLADTYVVWSDALDEIARFHAEQRVVANHLFLGPVVPDCGEE